MKMEVTVCGSGTVADFRIRSAKVPAGIAVGMTDGLLGGRHTLKPWTDKKILEALLALTNAKIVF
jgi:hypothetical protein